MGNFDIISDIMFFRDQERGSCLEARLVDTFGYVTSASETGTEGTLVVAKYAKGIGLGFILEQMVSMITHVSLCLVTKAP